MSTILTIKDTNKRASRRGCWGCKTTPAVEQVQTYPNSRWRHIQKMVSPKWRNLIGFYSTLSMIFFLLLFFSLSSLFFQVKWIIFFSTPGGFQWKEAGFLFQQVDALRMHCWIASASIAS